MKKTALFALTALSALFLRAQTTLEISTADQLAALAEAVNGGNDFRESTIILTADINLRDYEAWTPIGTMTNDFQGTFDGKGHRITNLRVRADAVETGFVAGLFGRVGAAGVVQDVTVGNLSVWIEDTGGYEDIACMVGAIAGRNDGSIVGCANRGVAVYGNWNHAYVGGIAGYNAGTVENCYNLGRVVTGANYKNNNVGGIVGKNMTESASVRNCFVRADVTQEVDGSSISGPIFGDNFGIVSSCFYMDAAPQAATLVLANNADNAPAIAAANGAMAQDVLLADRTIFSDEAWNTLCLPFNIPGAGNGRSPIAGATVRELDAANSGFNTSTGVLTLNFTDVTSMEAGKPYIVKWDEAISEDLTSPLFLGVTIADKTETERTICTTDGNVAFIGQFSPLTIPGEDMSLLYFGAENLLYYPDAAMQIGSCRAYFRLQGIDEGVQAVRQVVLNFDGQDSLSGIATSPSCPMQSGNPDYYTLDGRRLSAQSAIRGIYIKNRKKLHIK
ncbi:MAG: hypothetical protein IJ722_07755 [Alloprevotella sp.]|nr:hypothetical protein [Alloprevotella sp.]